MLHGNFLLGLLFGPEDGGGMFLRNVGWFHWTTRRVENLKCNQLYTGVVCPQLCISALVLLAVVGAEEGKAKKQEKRGLLGLGYGTLGGYGVGSGLTGYSGSGLANLALPPAPVPVAAPASAPLLPPPPVYAHPQPAYAHLPPVYPPSHVIGASVYTTITKQVSTQIIPYPLLVLI